MSSAGDVTDEAIQPWARPYPRPPRSSADSILNGYDRRNCSVLRRSLEKPPHLSVIPANAGIQGPGFPFTESEHLPTAQIPHLRHTRERGNPSPTGCAAMTPEAARHAGRPNQVGNLRPAAGLRGQYICATLPTCNTLRAHPASPLGRLGSEHGASFRATVPRLR